jgi:DNA mismatch repair protein MutL
VFAAEDLVRCTGSRGPLEVEAFLSRPDRARAGAGSLALFVNHRPVRDRALARAVAQAYGGVLEPGRFPVGAVFIAIPLESVDVNVHPQKSEVRFADGRAVADALFRVLEGELARALGTTRGQRSTGRGQERPWATPATWGSVAPSLEAASWVGSGSDVDHQGIEDVVASNSLSAPHGHLPVAIHAGRIEETGLDLTAPSTSDEGFAGLRFVTQLRGAYLLCESLDAVVILDRHGALEVVAFDRYKRQVRDGFVARRPLGVPVVVRRGARQVALVEEAHDDATLLGFDVRSSGKDSVSMHAIPALLGDADVEALAKALVAELSGSRDPSDQSGIDRVLATMACRGSLRAGEPFSDEQASSLIVALEAVELKGPCPHGRPVLTRVSYRELSQRAGLR